MIPYFRVLAYLLNVVFIICRHGYFYLMLAERFCYSFLKHKSQISRMCHCSQSIHIDCEQTFRLAKRIDSLADGGKLCVLIFIVHPLAYVFHGITQQVTDNCYGMALASAVCSVYPKTLVVVNVVSTHTLYDRTQHVVKLFIGDERNPFTLFFFCYVVSGFATTKLYYIVILSCHKCMIGLL